MPKHEIVSVTVMQIFTWRFRLGIEAVVKTKGSMVGRAICRAGISIGSHEVKFRYNGGEHWGRLGVGNAVRVIEEKIAPVLIGMDASDQYAISQAMLDICLEAKENIGDNAIVTVSATALKAGAESLGTPPYRHIGSTNTIYLPVSGVSMAAGHKWYGGGATTPDPKPAYSFIRHGFDFFSEVSCADWEVQERWRTTMKEVGIYPPNYYDLYTIPEGHSKSDEELWVLMTKAIQGAGYEGRIDIQADVTSDCYYDRKQGKYFGLFSAEPKTKEDMSKLYEHAVANHPLAIIEDPLTGNDYRSHAGLVKRVSIQIVGDDLFTTILSRVACGASIGATNIVLLKVNQVGTIGEILGMVQLVYRNSYGVMPCESRGKGAAITDYCVGINACAVKEMAVGLIVNRFLETEKKLGSKARSFDTADLQGRRFMSYGER